MREAQVGQRDRMIRLGLDSEVEIVFAIFREHRDDAGKVTYVQEARVHLERASEALTSDVASHDNRPGRARGLPHIADHARPTTSGARSIVKALGK